MCRYSLKDTLLPVGTRCTASQLSGSSYVQWFGLQNDTGTPHIRAVHHALMFAGDLNEVQNSSYCNEIYQGCVIIWHKGFPIAIDTQ